MSVDFSLYAEQDGKSVQVGNKINSLCFACLNSQNAITDYTNGHPLSNSVSGVRYYIDKEATIPIKNAIKWIRAVLYDFGVEKVIPEQTVKSIIRDGFYIEGKNVTGPMITGALSLMRCLDEEPDIVNTFCTLMDIEGMDAITAIVIAHGMSTSRDYNRNTYIAHRNPNNTNHTIYVGKVSTDTLKEAWDKVWLQKNEVSVPWVKDRSARGTFVFFSPVGNKYVEVDIFGNKNFGKEAFKTFLKEVIYPLREAHFAAK
jgi:hypothetical protein